MACCIARAIRTLSIVPAQTFISFPPATFVEPPVQPQWPAGSSSRSETTYVVPVDLDELDSGD